MSKGKKWYHVVSVFFNSQCSEGVHVHDFLCENGQATSNEFWENSIPVRFPDTGTIQIPLIILNVGYYHTSLEEIIDNEILPNLCYDYIDRYSLDSLEDLTRELYNYFKLNYPGIKIWKLKP
jgi:hypothetical protein